MEVRRLSEVTSECVKWESVSVSVRVKIYFLVLIN